MATVTGYTADALDTKLNAAVTSGSISTNGELTLQLRDGTNVDLGSIAHIAINASYPVGSIYMSTSPTNPGTSLGVGTWVAWGQGKVPVSVDTTQTEFNTVEKTGGEKTHTLTAAELAKHQHLIDHDHPLFQTPSGQGTHDHSVESSGQLGTLTGVFARGGSHQFSGTGMFSSDGSHRHDIDVPPLTGVASGDGSAFGVQGNPHNNLQPYITCYMWKRTA